MKTPWVAGDSFAACNRDTVRYEFRFQTTGKPTFIRCDPNEDGRLNIADAIFIIDDVFRDLVDASCTEALNCNGQGGNDLADVSYALAHLFLGGPPPPAPFGSCGLADGVDCASHSACQ